MLDNIVNLLGFIIISNILLRKFMVESDIMWKEIKVDT